MKNCPKCKEVNKPYRKTWVTILVALLFFPVGLFYLLVPKYICKNCRHKFA